MISITKDSFKTNFKQLSCSKCNKKYEASISVNISPCCGSILVCEYDYNFDRDCLKNRAWNEWRYYEMLPIVNQENIISLGEGGTPLLTLKSQKNEPELKIIVKDESLNPTGSFKARGMSVAISKAKELGIKKCVVPSAGNAGVAMAAYSLRAGIKATVILPSITPRIYVDNCLLYKAKVVIEDGLIDACGKKAEQLSQTGEYFDLSTLKEPYRLEGKKIMGYEIAESLEFNLPDVIVYPTGGGTGLVGIWKAFQEMKKLGWLSNKLPKMVAVQVDKCCPVVDKWDNNALDSSKYLPSIAHGLNVPKAFGMDLIMKCLRESNGAAISVNESEIRSGQKEIFNKDGILISSEGAAAYAGLKNLFETGFIQPGQTVLILNTGGVYSSL